MSDTTQIDTTHIDTSHIDTTTTDVMESGRTARPAKLATVAEIAGKLGASQAVFVSEYRGLSVKQLADVRNAIAPGRRRARRVQEHAGPDRRPRAGLEGLDRCSSARRR